MTVLCEEVVTKKGWRESGPVIEQLIADFRQIRFVIACIEIASMCAVEVELTEILAESCSNIQKVLSINKAAKDIAVHGMSQDADVLEQVEADARVRDDIPGFVALWPDQ